MSKINNKETFERAAPNYIRDDSHWGSDLDLIKNSIDGLLKDNNHIKWSDLNCGPGFHITSLGEVYKELKITGRDYSPAMLKEARARADKLGLTNIDLKPADIIDAQIGDSYNLITFLNNGLGNLHKDGIAPKDIRSKVIGKISDSLSTEGHFILSVYNKEKLDLNYGNKLALIQDLSNLKEGDLIIRYVSEEGASLYYSHWFSEEEIHNLTEKAGLKINFLERRLARFVVRCKKKII